MSSTADDSHSPLADVHQSPISVSDSKNNEKQEESGDQNSKNVREGEDNSTSSENSVTSPEIDLLRLGNNKAVKEGATDEMAGEKSKAEEQISPDRREVDENRCEVIYNFPPDFSILNINGRSRFELVTVRENGRLQIFMVPYRCPQLARSPLRNGRLRIWLLNSDQHSGEQVSPLHEGQDARKRN